MILQISSEFRYSCSIISAILSVKFDKSITLQENYFTVILWQHLKFDDFCIHTPFKFHGQISYFIAPNSWLVDASSHNIFPILWNFNWGADPRHVKILNELHSSSDVQVFTLQGSLFSVWQPLQKHKNKMRFFIQEIILSKQQNNFWIYLWYDINLLFVTSMAINMLT